MKAAHSDRQPEPVKLPRSAEAPPAIELRHLRYFVALADVGSFTRAAERMFIAQPTLSQQIRRLEMIIGTPLLQRSREGGHGAAGRLPGRAVPGGSRDEPDQAGGRPRTAAPARGAATAPARGARG